MRKLLVVCTVIFGIGTTAEAQLMRWDFEQVDSLYNIEKRPLFVFMHTTWCKYCKAMEQTTFKDDEVISQLNVHFYFVSFDPENPSPIYFAGRKFAYLPTGPSTGVNELAMQIGMVDEQLNYPTIAVLNSKYELVFQHNAFLSKKDMKRLLTELVASVD